MGDSKKNKEKSGYSQWGPEETKILIGHKHYLSRIKYLRDKYQNHLDLQRFNSGFGWDPDMKRFTAPDEV